MTQDVAVETPAADDAETVVEDVKAEEVVVEETDKGKEPASPENDNEETEAVEPQETVEQKVERLERETAGKQKAIDRKTAAYHDLQKAHEAKIQELAELQAKLTQQEPEKEPSIDDFETHDEYVNALADYRADKKAREAQQKYLQQQQAAEQAKIVQERNSIVQKQEAEYIAVNPKYEAAKAEFSSFVLSGNIPKAVEDAIVTQAFDGNVPQVIDYFGANNGERLDELAEITKMPPIKAAIEIYKIQQKLKAPVKKEEKPLPKPVKKVVGTSKGSKDLYEGDVLENLGLKS